MRACFILVVLLLVVPPGSRAASVDETPSRYTQVNEGYVRVTEISGRNSATREHSRARRKEIYEQTVTVYNGLDLELIGVKLELGYLGLDQDVHVVRREDSWLVFNASGPTPVNLIYEPRIPAVQERPTAAIVSYRLAADPAKTPGLTRALFLLSNSKGLVDLAVAANTLDSLGPEAAPVRDQVRALVAGGPLKLIGEVGKGIPSLYALRLLGRVGTREDVPLLLSVLESRKDWSQSLDAITALRTELPGHPMSNLFASGATLERVVEDAVRDLDPVQAAPALVKVAYEEGPHRSLARGLLRKWTPVELVDLLRKSGAEETLRVLCASRAPEAVTLIVGLGTAGVAGVDLKACLSAMPQKETNAALVGVLGAELGPLEETVFALLAARSTAVQAGLRARASNLKPRVDAANTEALARALHARLRSERVGALQEKLDAVDGAVREEQFDAALALLEKTFGETQGREQRAKLTVARVRVAQAAARARAMDVVDKALEGIEVPQEGRERSADLEPELTELARIVMSFWKDRRVESQLERVEARVSASARPELARIYMEAIGGAEQWDRSIYAERALALDSSNAAAKLLIEEVASDRAREKSLRSLATICGVFLFVGLVLWFIVSRLRETA
ncbi:hypothetical protein JY651_15760 [Pyxidicoccus parkwayensis]|uniref:HEAT repeat domain-containing protein n=1 Tax=Pyxidicoccus parkwayensis TaxID=2813578 RepID=A0ABX7P774_9BACT|nr:hypothetical protein [Pyxidicoccus parkwaysis]QSQ26294.1 hypothetical protein JY651_15760 [Pyxidicoccus parkwaysis]